MVCKLVPECTNSIENQELIRRVFFLLWYVYVLCDEGVLYNCPLSKSRPVQEDLAAELQLKDGSDGAEAPYLFPQIHEYIIAVPVDCREYHQPLVSHPNCLMSAPTANGPECMGLCLMAGS